jgi:uncharacterized membrane protein
MASAVVAVLVLTILMPDDVLPGPGWLLPLIEGLLLVAVVVSDPGTIDRPRRALDIGLVAVLVLGALWSTVVLTAHLINGGQETQSAHLLLTAGSTVWASNILAFALLYWQLDSGGSAARARHPREHPDLAFPEQLNPRVAPANWRPRFYDYLYLGFTNATAFSPTDAMPLAPWIKGAMAVQALISLVILGLVIAWAVNVFA